MTAPDHGTRARYLSGCRCDDCGNAHYRYMSRWRLDHQRGQRRRIDAAQTRAHAERLAARGWTTPDIARATGLPKTTIRDILDGRTVVTRTTAAAVLALPVTGSRPPSLRDTEGTGTVRRLRALVAHGYTAIDLGNRLNMASTWVSRTVTGNPPTVRIRTAERVTALYRTLAEVPGPSDRARGRAARQGWAGPAYWDEDDFDNPEFEPALPGSLRRNEQGAVRRAEVEHLASFGLGHEEIAARLSMSPSYVRDIVRELRTDRPRERTAA